MVRILIWFNMNTTHFLRNAWLILTGSFWKDSSTQAPFRGDFCWLFLLQFSLPDSVKNGPWHLVFPITVTITAKKEPKQRFSQCQVQTSSNTNGFLCMQFFGMYTSTCWQSTWHAKYLISMGRSVEKANHLHLKNFRSLGVLLSSENHPKPGFLPGVDIVGPSLFWALKMSKGI